MPKHRVSATKRRRGWNRGDLAILLCGVLGFFSLAFGTPLLQHGEAAAPGGSIHSAGPTSYVEWPLSDGATTRTGSLGPAAPVSTDPPATPASVSAAQPAPAGPLLPAASAPQHIQYAAAAIDTAIHPLEPDNSAVASQTIVPPTTMDGYWLTPFGTPGNGSNNTTYIIGHSWEGQDAPFNHLSSAASVGDEFNVITANGTIRYRVDSVTTYLKSTLKDSPIWDMVPNRVVLISCYTEDPWGKNVVVSASPAT
ncbi:sortase [Arthrobacter sp. ISL-48]|uniref:class F sortase n=1 Tax=Arthrobacter sp. ISL-48 TaxID=2819110 RepID=UPI001BE6FECD|nr:class F sortase [Arthrobacter sp. ISL-48]MBT2533530.1 sortase [Arthrobacter sp. ISL-48]